jgi:hypothetical protein
MKTNLKLLSLLFATSLAGCPEQGGDVDSARNAFPKDLEIAVPEQASKLAAQLGELSPAYVTTRTVAAGLNGGMAWVGLTIRVITAFPVSDVQDDSLIWGPWTDALNPSIYRLRMTDNRDGSWDWSLEGHLKSQPTAAFRAAAYGTAHEGSPGRGTGTFTLDFEVSEELDPVGNNGHGKVVVTYDLESSPIVLTLDADRDDLDQPVQWHYDFRGHADGSGDFVLSAHADLDNGGADEVAEIRSRWNAQGAGRSDAHVSGGDLGVTVQVSASECWDTSFLRVYYADSANWLPTEGDPAACAFADASLPD